ncbi:MAG: histidinol-phosphate transaminase [Sedimentibacter sp.]|uniref:pyridoxal phosphate-dependent aminotransferase n=1 Tax=Sedimentibacter sp. TaxID=1960295 RepID=UPI0029821D11|nr:histidinol-phosphate transaminase [Sedimentibacter sp.]MDW5299785.1 histidinol-phosphate transaminase [Sedimentibacter sp.]
MIDLSSNENPHEPSQNVINALLNSTENINRYVGAKELNDLKKKLSNYNQVSEDRIFIGPGTDFLINEVLMNFSKGRNIVTFNPNFFSSVESAKYFVKKVIKIQLIPPEYSIDWNAYQEGSSIFILDNPNNPTGKCLLSKDELIKLLENKNNIVLIDEAYFEFSQVSFTNLLWCFPNLAILRTLDKAFALAGLKISYLMAGDNLLKRLSLKNQSISRPACNAAVAAIESQNYSFECVKEIINEREHLKRSLENLGLTVFPSQTNFLLVKTSIQELALKLKSKNILICDLSGTWFKDYYRIGVGSTEDNYKLTEAIKEFL